jgi:ankyrin repeat protein
MTTLHQAALTLDRPRILEALAAGANPNALDSQGRSPLICALIASPDYTCSQLFLRAKRNICVRTLLDGGAVPDQVAIRTAGKEWSGELMHVAYLASLRGCSQSRLAE